MPEPSYFQDMFDTWEAAVAYQRIALQYYLDAGCAIRACEIHDEKDFRTGKQKFMVFVRAFIVVNNATP